MSSSFPFWWVFATLLAMETVAVVGFALGLKGLTPSPRWGRVIWHCCFLALGLLLLSTATGAGRRFAGWVSGAGTYAATREIGPAVSGAHRDPKGDPSQGSGIGGFSKLDEFRAGIGSAFTASADAGTPLPVTQVSRGEPATHRPDLLVTSMNGGGEPAARLPMIDEPSVDTKERSLTVDMTAQAGLAPTDPSVVLGREREASPVSRWFEVSDAWWGALWGIGVTIVLLRVGLARFLSVVFRLRRQPFPDAGLRARVQALGVRLGCRRTIGVLASPRLLGPVAMGLARPAVVLPSDFATRFSAAQQEAMLAHEVAHLAAHDPAWHFLADGVAALLWWHPLIWHARRELHRASEHAADEASLVIENGPLVLAECLVALGAQRGRRRSAVELGVEGQGFRSGLGRRVERLLHLGGQAWRPLNPARSGVVKTTVPIVVAGIAILSAAWAVPQALTQGDPMTKLQQTWKRSLAAVTVAVSLGTEPSSIRLAAQTNPATPTAAAEEKAAATTENPTPTPAAAPENAAVPTEAPDQAAPSEESPPVRPVMSAEMMRRYGLTPTAAAKSAQPGMSAAMMRRYGLTPRALPTAVKDDPGAAATADSSEPVHDRTDVRNSGRTQIERKLETISFDQIAFPDGMLLGQAVEALADAVRQKDPEGINWVISQRPDPDSRPVDPTTGLPATDPRTAGEVTLHANQPLRGLKLKDVLDVITKVAERPIRYTVENYGVVFALGNPGAEPATTPEERRPIMSVEMMRRYGMMIQADPQAADPASRLRAKLNRIVFPEFRLPHGMLLSDVLRYMDEETRKRDPEKQGVNFILTRIADGVASQTALDPTTGLPVPAAPAIGEVSVRGGLDLRQVSVKDVLEALPKVVDAPIRCDFLPYGVVISPALTRASMGLSTRMALRSEHPKTAIEPRLVSRAFQLDKRHFLPRLKATFGIAAGGAAESTVESGASGGGASQSSAEYNPNAADVRAAVVKLAEHLGVSFHNPSKEVFYNLETGMLMLRATAEDLETMAAAMETLSDGDKTKNVKF